MRQHDFALAHRESSEVTLFANSLVNQRRKPEASARDLQASLQARPSLTLRVTIPEKAQLQRLRVGLMNHHTATLEFSYMILEYFRYTGSNISQWLPFVKSTLDFYDQHYRMRAGKYAASEYDKNGKLVLFPTSACECHYFTTNPATDVSGLHAVVKGVMDLPDNWINNYFGGKEEVNRLYSTLPDIHYETINGELAQYNPLLTEKPQILVLNKMDIPGTDQIAEIFKEAVTDRPVLMISAAARKGIDALKFKLVEYLGIPVSSR